MRSLLRVKVFYFALIVSNIHNVRAKESDIIIIGPGGQGMGGGGGGGGGPIIMDTGKEKGKSGTIIIMPPAPRQQGYGGFGGYGSADYSQGYPVGYPAPMYPQQGELSCIPLIQF